MTITETATQHPPHPADTEPVTSFSESFAKADATRLKAETDARLRIQAAELKERRSAPDIAQAEAEADEIRDEAAQRRRERHDERQKDEAAEDRKKAARAKGDDRVRKAVGASLAVALPMQLLFFFDVHPALIVAPFLLEGLAWVWLALVEAANTEGRPAWKFRIGVLVIAGIVAYINYTHGGAFFGDTSVGLAGAIASLAGPLTWDQWSQYKRRADNGEYSRLTAWWRTRETNAAEKTAAENAARETIAALTAERARLHGYENEHPDVWREAVSLRGAYGHDTISPDLWAEAWMNVHQLPVGQTAATLAAREEAKARAVAARIPVEQDTPIPVLLQDGRIRVFGKSRSGADKSTDSPTANAGGSLGGIGKQRTSRTRRKDSVQPLAEADLTAARALYEAVNGDRRKFSTQAVRNVLGGGANNYAKRVRDAVRDEHRNNY